VKRHLESQIMGLALLLSTARVPAVPALQESAGASLYRRVEAASRRYMGTPYRLFPLGEGSAKLGSPKPLVDERHVDCMTYVEQALAHALASRPSEVAPLLQRIRYRDGHIRFGARNHYLLADWLPNNSWLVKDDTRRVGGKEARTVEKVLDRGLPAREGNLPQWRESLPARGGRTAETVTYIPSSSVPGCMSRFPEAAIVAFVSPRKSMDASHVGFVFRRNGWTLRHASSTRGKVIDEPFLDYVKRRGRGILGVAVLDVRDDAT
jgi:hypothetical protein